jgi:hypothetical protein
LGGPTPPLAAQIEESGGGPGDFRSGLSKRAPDPAVLHCAALERLGASRGHLRPVPSDARNRSNPVVTPMPTAASAIPAGAVVGTRRTRRCRTPSGPGGSSRDACKECLCRESDHRPGEAVPGAARNHAVRVQILPAFKRW